MTTTPPTPTTVEPGQIWRDNDQRSKGAGEFVVVAVEKRERGMYAYPTEVAVVRRYDSERTSAIRVDRLLNHTGRRSGYTYVGRSR